MTFAEAIQPTLEWLKAGAPHTDVGTDVNVSFNMNWFHHRTGCGTSCCIAGHVCLVHGKAYTPRLSFVEAWEILGLTQDEADVLFYAKGFGKKLDKITPEEAVKTIEHYIATGRMDWAEANA